MIHSLKHFKAYQQLEYSDCGITCIRMICHHYGKNISLKTLREMCDVSRLGISLKDIIKCLQTLHFEVAAVKITAEEVLRMPLPAILFWRQNHFVVLYKIDKQKKTLLCSRPSTRKSLIYRRCVYENVEGYKSCRISCNNGSKHRLCKRP